MQVIVDRSGKMLKNRKYKCDRADLRNNTRVGVLNMRNFFATWDLFQRCLSSCAQVAIATLRGYAGQRFEGGVNEARTRMSSFVIAEALLRLYQKKNLLPKGIDSDHGLAQTWAVKIGHAARKLVTNLQLRLKVRRNPSHPCMSLNCVDFCLVHAHAFHIPAHVHTGCLYAYL